MQKYIKNPDLYTPQANNFYFSFFVCSIDYGHYVGEAVIHSENGLVAKGYDWYGFLAAGVRSAVVVLPILILITWGISVALWNLNRLKEDKN